MFGAGRVLAPLLAALALVSTAHAQPTVWQRARDPGVRHSEKLLRSMGRMIDDAGLAESEPVTLKELRLATLVMADLSGAQALDDATLWLVVGHVIVDADVGREDEAGALADRLLERVGPHDRWLEAEARVLQARAARSSAERAIQATTRALPLVWEPVIRSALLRERAQAKMARGDVRGSAVDQRAALAAADRASDRALARFGLGLALERSGDLPSALAELRLAHATAPAASGEPGVLDEPGSFLFRAFDVHYVSALTAMALAERALDREGTLAELERALADWERFEITAPGNDPWLGSARLHRAACARARDEQLARRTAPP
jgi:tetratricopeptide (TPR) repeat protein